VKIARFSQRLTMTQTIDRRDFLAAFLQGAGCFAVAAGLPAVPRIRPVAGRVARFHFPEGLASGDPMPDGVVLWTRVEALNGATPPRVGVTVQVATEPTFARVVVERKLTAVAAADHTVRVVVTGLLPDTIYHYRFVAEGDVIDLVGRTRTAPLPGVDRPVRLAFASCQSYEAGYYGAWRLLLNEDLARPPAEQLDFVLHLGDFIYETLGYGSARRIDPLPSGGASLGEGVTWATAYAVTVDDYRHLYKTYLRDPDLRAARARWPFIVTWDDHEFTDDCWQTSQTYVEPPVANQPRRLAASQAWFEFIPALLSGRAAQGGVTNRAHDFAPAAVAAAPLTKVDEAGFSHEPNNMAAIGTLTIHRTMRWGRHVELVVGDNRSYRSAHCVPGELAKAIGGGARYVLPLEVVEVFDAGRQYANGNPPATIQIGETTIPNPRRTSAPGSMLGAPQKQWWKDTMRASTATWKLWANSVPALPLRFDLGSIDPKAHTAVSSIDSWEGYPTERAELLRFLETQQVANVVSLTGDHHSNFAGVLAADFGAAVLRPVATEYAVAGITSESLFHGFVGAMKADNPLRPIVVYDSTAHGGTNPTCEALNLTWRHGCRASAVLAKTGDMAQAMAADNPMHGRHLRYVDTNAQGIAVVAVHADRLECELITIEEPVVARGTAGATVLRRARFTQPVAPAGAPVTLAEPVIEGTPPFPGVA
jgi:alkaline phosphatase D